MLKANLPHQITGGAGFVGSQLAHHLHEQGHPVILLDSMAFGHLDNLIISGQTFGRLIVEDIRTSLAKLTALMEGVHTVFHFAAVAALPVCQSNPSLAYDVNVSGTGNILEAARLAKVKRVIFASTSAIYEATAMNQSRNAFREDDPVAPNLAYSMTKDAAEKLCQAYSTNYGMDIIIVRFFNIYGPHQDFKRLSPPFTSYLATELAHNRAPTLFNSSTTALRDYVYSADLISLLNAMFQKTGKNYDAEIFNACSGEGHSAPEIFEMMSEHAGTDVEPCYGEPEKFWGKYPELVQEPYPLNPGRIAKEVYKMSLGDPAKTQREFGWRAKTGMREGLGEVWKYTLENI